MWLSPLQRILTVLFSPVFQHCLLNPSCFLGSSWFPLFCIIPSLSEHSFNMPTSFVFSSYLLFGKQELFLQAQLFFSSYGPSVFLVSPCLPCSWWELLKMVGAFLEKFGLTYNPTYGPWCSQESSLETDIPTGGPISLRHWDGLDYFLSGRTFYSSSLTFPCKLKWGNHFPNRQAQGE